MGCLPSLDPAGETLYQDSAALVPVLRAVPLQLDAPLLELVHEVLHRGLRLPPPSWREALVDVLPRADDDPLQEDLEDGAVGAAGGGAPGRLLVRVRQEVARGPEPVQEGLQLGAPPTGPARPRVAEAMGQDAPDELLEP